MKNKFTFIIISMVGLSLSFGCASKDWTKGQVKIAQEKAIKKYQKQNTELGKKYDQLLTKNKDLYELLNKLFTENKNLYANCKTLKLRLNTLEKSITKTQTKVQKDVIAFVRKNDMKVYKHVTIEQQKHISKLKAEMKKVESANQEAKKLREVIEKILKAYKNAK
jgi:chromosome segregation ATPase